MQGGGPALLIGAYAETFEFFRQQVLAGVLHRVLVRGRRADLERDRPMLFEQVFLRREEEGG